MAKSSNRDAAATKATILAAAEELFAERGFAGTSIKKISEKSGASGPLIIFHFKDKSGLYVAVKAAIVKRYSECLPAPLDSHKPFHESLENIVKSMFSFYKNNPTLLRLANWGRLEGEVDPWQGEEEWHHRYVDHIRAAQQNGEIRDDISPLRVLVMICGAIHIWWEYHEHFLKDLGKSEDGETADGEYLDELISVVLRGLSQRAK